jgi:hypothetical protein
MNYLSGINSRTQYLKELETPRLTFRQADAGAMPRKAAVLVIGKGVGNPRQHSLRWRWAGESRDRSERGRSEVVVLVREVVWVTAMPAARCTAGNGHIL